MANEGIELDKHFQAQTPEAWVELATKTLKGRDPKTLRREVDGVTVEPIYFEARCEERGLPGYAPFVRGNGQPGWAKRQSYAGASLEHVKRAILDDFHRDARSFWLLRHTGAFSVPVRTLDDFLALIQPVMKHDADVEWVLDTGSHALEAAAIFDAASKRLGQKLRARIYVDPIAELAQNGALLHASFSEVYDAVEWASDEEQIHVGAVNALVAHDAGASPSLELGWVLGNIVEMHRRAPSDDAFRAWVEGAAVLTGIGSDIFTEIARVRALRLLISKVTRALTGEALSMHVHGVTSAVTLASRDPWSNMLRGTVQAFVGAVGGVDALSVRPFDEANGAADELGQRLATNTHNVLAQEAHLAASVDPAGGSYYLETLTDALAREGWAAFQAIEEDGGLVASLKNDAIQRRICNAWKARTAEIHTRNHPIIGVSEFPDADESRLDRAPRAMWHDSNATRANIDRTVAALSEAFDAGAAWDTLQSIGALVMCDALEPVREAEEWEALRDRVESRAGKVFLANIGDIPRHKARAAFAQRLFEAAGFEVVTNDGFESASAAADAFAASGAGGTVICGHNDDYGPHGEPFARAMKGANFVVLAGSPCDDHRAALEKAGVTDFISLGSDVFATVSRAASTLED